MWNSNGSCIIVAFLLLLSTFSNAEDDEARQQSAKQTSQVYLYRHLNWCIVGKGEYPLNEWPLNQFRPILDKTRKNEKQYDVANKEKLQLVQPGISDPWEKYDLLFSPIKCEGLAPTGFGSPDSGQLMHRVHIQFKPKSSGDTVPFQGLLIQAVHAPFGLGFPFGVFDTDNEFKCGDCNYQNLSRIVGCISRPDSEAMHPTVSLFHYKLRDLQLPKQSGQHAHSPQGPPEADGTVKDGDGEGEPGSVDASVAEGVNPEYGFKPELHWNFKWANLPCSSARLVEFWILMVLDFENRAWTVKKYGPYDFNSLDYSSKLEDPKKIQIDGKDVIQPGLPTPIIPECYPFKKKPIKIDINKGRPRSCFRKFKSYNPDLCHRWELKVRSGSSGLPGGGGEPVEKEKESKIKCEDGAAPLTAATDKTRIRVVGDFDAQCVRRYPGLMYEAINSKTKRQPYKVCPQWQGRFQCRGTDDEFKFDREIPAAGSDNVERSFPSSHCDECKPVTEEVTEPPDEMEPIFKRTAHGVMMIFAFFFFNPVSINVARFYKETLHERQVKGWRIWLVIHVGFAVMASVFSYIGYTFPTFKESNSHITLGYGAMIGVSSGIVTGWVRHKNQLLRTCMFYLHALSGYLGWALAIASLIFAPDISQYTRLVSYAASAICLAAMGIMTVHICSVDSQLGLRPKRSHIPIVQIRFEDIIPPNPLFRKIFLYIYIALQFLICFGMLVL